MWNHIENRIRLETILKKIRIENEIYNTKNITEFILKNNKLVTN